MFIKMVSLLKLQKIHIFSLVLACSHADDVVFFFFRKDRSFLFCPNTMEANRYLFIVIIKKLNAENRNLTLQKQWSV